jgi:hypothetical protein
MAELLSAYLTGHPISKFMIPFRLELYFPFKTHTKTSMHLKVPCVVGVPFPLLCESRSSRENRPHLAGTLPLSAQTQCPTWESLEKAFASDLSMMAQIPLAAFQYFLTLLLSGKRTNDEHLVDSTLRRQIVNDRHHTPIVMFVACPEPGESRAGRHTAVTQLAQRLIDAVPGH